VIGEEGSWYACGVKFVAPSLVSLFAGFCYASGSVSSSTLLLSTLQPAFSICLIVVAGAVLCRLDTVFDPRRCQ